MKRLNRILLINWYLLDAEEIPVDGHAAFIGPNASGKSSILDAVQTVLVGGHGHFLSLNASAGEKSTRSLRDYCLGVIRDTDQPDQLSADLRAREQAITYLVLSFRDDQDDSETAVGLAMHASQEKPREHIDGRFIVPNASLILHDFLKRDGELRQPRPWNEVREDLRRRYPDFRHIPQPEQFVREMGQALSVDGRSPIDFQRFLKNFNNAITFAPIRNVSEFVRRYILDSRPIRIRDLQDSLRTYREIADKTREVSERLDDLKAINELYSKSERAHMLADRYAWAAAESEFNALEAEIEPLQEQLEDRKQTRLRLDGGIDTLEQEQERIRQSISAIEARLQATDTGREKARLEAERTQQAARVAELERELKRLQQWVNRAELLCENREKLPEALHEPLDALADHLQDDDQLLDGSWPHAPEALDQALAQLRQPLLEATGQLNDQLEQAVSNEQTLAKDMSQLRERLAKLEDGGADLSSATRTLMELLDEQGIRATPLCDVVDLSDEDWRDTVEAHLGGLREALLVPPEQARDAVRIYRTAGRSRRLHGCRVINTRQSERWADRCDKGSLAEVVHTDNPHARAYLNRQLGNIQRVDDEEALLKHNRAATADGMLASGGSVVRLRPQEPMLGRSAQEQVREQAQSRFAELAEAYAKAVGGKEITRQLLNEALTPLLQGFTDLPALTDLVAGRDHALAQMNQLLAQSGELDSGDYQRLEAQRHTEQQRLEANRTEIQQHRQSCEEAVTAAAHLQAQLATLEGRVQACSQARLEAAEAPGLDMTEAGRLLEKLEEEHASEDEESRYATLRDIAKQRSEQQNRRSTDWREQAIRRLGEHRARHSDDEPDENLSPEAWVARQLRLLEESTLADFAERAKNALDEAEYAFRADFVGRLQENLQVMGEKLREINRYLQNRPFHGEFYEFVARPNPEFEDLIQWVESWTPEEGSEVGGLFDSYEQGEHPHALAIARVREMLLAAAEDGDAEVEKRLADYRNYYNFDVRMSDSNGQNATLLSKRIGKGSGGEHQSPFYVAIGAALAATYNLHRDQNGRLNGGMALALFDEAFSKLDVHNTVNALQFLDDLGLQVLLAAPDEKHGLMSELMNTIVNVYRTGGAVSIEPEYLKPAAHALLREDNPVRAKTN